MTGQDANAGNQVGAAENTDTNHQRFFSTAAAVAAIAAGCPEGGRCWMMMGNSWGMDSRDLLVTTLTTQSFQAGDHEGQTGQKVNHLWNDDESQQVAGSLIAHIAHAWLHTQFEMLSSFISHYSQSMTRLNMRRVLVKLRRYHQQHTNFNNITLYPSAIIDIEDSTKYPN